MKFKPWLQDNGVIAKGQKRRKKNQVLKTGIQPKTKMMIFKLHYNSLVDNKNVNKYWNIKKKIQ